MTTTSDTSGRAGPLAPEQQAVLSLLVRQRRRYAQIASMLAITERAVHDRAHAALALLAPSLAREVPAEEREQIGEYLLGQQEPAPARSTRALLERSPQARAWAQALATELSGLGAEHLPEIPSPPRARERAGTPDGAPTQPQPPPGERDRRGPGAGAPAISRRGGAVLLGAIAAAAIAALIIALSSGGKGGSTHGGGSPGTAHGTTTTTTTAAGQPHIEAQLNLVPPEPGSSALGVVEIVSQGSRRAFFLAAEKLPPTKGFFYAVWLYNSQSNARALGRAPAVGASGRLATQELLPSNASAYSKIVLTRETSPRPSQPGPIVLEGKLRLR